VIAADAETPVADVDFRRKGLLEPVKAEARESAISKRKGNVVAIERIRVCTIGFKSSVLSRSAAHDYFVESRSRAAFCINPTREQGSNSGLRRSANSKGKLEPFEALEN
jgi:hypothetical protein